MNKMRLLILAICLLGIAELLDAAFGPQSIWEVILPAVAVIVALIAAFKKE